MKRAPYSRGEKALIWLCVFTPGTAAAMIAAAYLHLLWSLFEPTPLWHHAVLWGPMLLILLACCGFAGWISATKSGGERIARRMLKPACGFFLAQVLIAPLVGWLLLWLMLRDG